LHLRNNKLKELPRNFLAMEALESLYLYGNNITGIPKEVIATGEYDNSRDSVWDYLKSLERDEARFLHQAKMILVGNGEVGKDFDSY
jgi:internalin A